MLSPVVAGGVRGTRGKCEREREREEGEREKEQSCEGARAERERGADDENEGEQAERRDGRTSRVEQTSFDFEKEDKYRFLVACGNYWFWFVSQVCLLLPEHRNRTASLCVM